MTPQRADARIRHALTAAWILVGLPVVTSAVSAWRGDWLPIGDVAIVAAKVADSTTTEPPLVGGWTSLGRMDDEPLHHAGPLGLWLLAAPTRLLGSPGAGLVLGAAAITIVSLALLAVCIRRWGHPQAEAALILVTAAMVASLGGDRFSDPNAPFVGTMPLFVVLVATIGVSLGHHRQFWALIAAGSLAAQTHLGYAPLVGVAVLVAVGLIVVRGRAEDEDEPVPWRRTLSIGVGLGLVAWIGPIIDQLFSSQNLSRLLTERASSEEPTVGFGVAFDILIDTTATPGGWLRGRADNGPLPDPSMLDLGLAAVTLVALVAVGVAAHRRRDLLTRAISATAIGTLIVATISAASVTAIEVGAGLLYYRLFWWPAGALCTAALLLGGLHLLERVVNADRGLPIVVFAAALVAIVLVPFGHHGVSESSLVHHRPLLSLSDAIVDHPDSGDGVLFLLDEPAGSTVITEEFFLALMSPTVIAELRLSGIDVRFPVGEFNSDRGPIGAYAYGRPATGNEGLTVLFRTGAEAMEAPPEGFELLIRDPGATDPDVSFSIPTAAFVSAG